ncbi:N-acetyltransferase [Pilimelia anulata]|uniref:N-acetyltransferase n=1 Tax=Pilimelia anulata TaxID=53371 RepID=A0A8J3BC97_9ACTN|nr:GNAT family N-acetyltransferase [Pilimelia anulata]GGJ97456.1 N-acetyltransferase [Pilimelia anulata]
MVNLTEPLRTERLVVRPYTPADLPHVRHIQSLPEVTRYLLFGPRDEAEARVQLERKVRRGGVLAAEGDALELAVTLPDGTYLGEVLLFHRSAEHLGGELGYMFLPEHGGRGYATEAAAALLPLAFDGAGLHRVHARLDARNRPSARVLERLGMRLEAHFVRNEYIKGEWTDELIYALLADEWRAARSG